MSKLEEVRQQLFIIETQVNVLIEQLDELYDTFVDESINYEISDILELCENLKSDLDSKEDILYTITKGE